MTNTEYEMTMDERLEWQEREHPVCDECGERLGRGCDGHEFDEEAS